MMKTKHDSETEIKAITRSLQQIDGLRQFALKLVWMLLALALVFGMSSPLAAELDCLVKPEMYVELSSPVDSVLEEILVETGDTVTRGQPLVKLEASVQQAKVRLARLQAKSDSDIKNREEQLRYAKQYF